MFSLKKSSPKEELSVADFRPEGLKTQEHVEKVGAADFLEKNVHFEFGQTNISGPLII